MVTSNAIADCRRSIGFAFLTLAMIGVVDSSIK
jgi:hypothetical protein